jgi:hypothetical protein
MPISRVHLREVFDEVMSELRAGLHGPLKFLGSLSKDDDWSFVIKAQAMVEASVTEAILSKVGERSIRSVVERLPLADEQIGKINLAKELGLVSAEQRRFVRRLAELRNRLAHRVEHVNFSFEGYVQSLSAAEIRAWKSAVSWFALGQESENTWLEAAQTKPRVALFVSIFMLFALLKVSAVEAEMPKKLDGAALRTAEELFSLFATHDGDA